MAAAAFLAGCKQLEDTTEPTPEVNITEGAVASDQLEFYISATQADEIVVVGVETSDVV